MGDSGGPGGDRSSQPQQPVKTAFAPVADPAAVILILGSMPGEASLAQQQYYAHPRNAFWPMVEALFGIAAGLPYPDRVRRLAGRGVALWDVLQSCRRPGSLDSSIDRDSIVVNDFARFFAAHPAIRQLFFNGARAEAEYRRRVLPGLPVGPDRLPALRLPSTSPAMASLSFDQKLGYWSRVREVLDGGQGRPPVGVLPRRRESSAD